MGYISTLDDGERHDIERTHKCGGKYLSRGSQGITCIVFVQHIDYVYVYERRENRQYIYRKTKNRIFTRMPINSYKGEREVLI